LKAAGHQVKTGERTLAALSIVVGVAVLREGSEVVLFLYGIAAAGDESGGAMALGGFLGMIAGAASGAALYLGLVRIPLHRLFVVTSWLILLLAAGMASQAASFLMQADLLPPLGANLWDTSGVLAEQSIAGKVLHTLIGYTAQPAGIQLVFYVATVLLIGGLMLALGGVRPAARAKPSIASHPSPQPGE
jgi:high-affinity iron transporter